MLYTTILYEDTHPCFTPVNLTQFKTIFLLLLVLVRMGRFFKVFSSAERCLLLSHQNVVCWVTHALFLLESATTHAP